MATSEMHRPDARHDDRRDHRRDEQPDEQRDEQPDQRPDERIGDAGEADRWLRVEARTSSVPVARRYVRRALARLLPADRLDTALVETLNADLELAASELITNAVEHGDGRPVELSVSCDGAVVALEVVSRGEAERVGPAEEWRVADIGSITGRGLGIVRAVSDRVMVERADDTVRIRVERDLPA